MNPEITMPMHDRKAVMAASAITYLEDRKIAFVIKNGGTHLVIDAGIEKLDYWPTTGRWRVQGAFGPTMFGSKSLFKRYDESIAKKLKVLIHVRGGVAEVVSCPGNVEVEIKDWDNEEA